MIIQKLLAIVNLGAAWVLWLLVGLSVISVGIMIERTFFFLGRRLPGREALSALLLAGEFKKARETLGERFGIEADVLRAALDQTDSGPDSVAKVVDANIKRSRLEYESRLAFLATLGNNAPFIGLFGTVLGIIKAFADLSHNQGGGAATVMSGISAALVATAVGLMVALPAVVAFNIFQGRIRRTMGRVDALAHMILTGIREEAAKGSDKAEKVKGG